MRKRKEILRRATSTLDRQGGPSTVVMFEFRSNSGKECTPSFWEKGRLGELLPKRQVLTLLHLISAFSASSFSHFSSCLLFLPCHYIIYSLTQIWIWEFGQGSYITHFIEVGFFLLKNLGHNTWHILSIGNWFQLCAVASLWMRHFPKSILYASCLELGTYFSTKTTLYDAPKPEHCIINGYLLHNRMKLE